MNGVDSRDTTSAERRCEQQQGRIKSYSNLQLFFLLRLQRMLNVQREHTSQSNSDDWRARLLSKAIYSTYCDCIEQGVGEDARTLFVQGRKTGHD